MKYNTSAPSGGANSKKTIMPPASEEYRNSYDSIFRKPIATSVKLRLKTSLPHANHEQ